ncbi:NAD(P)/FAD-dependent oxidoreductase [Dysgonomonas sp. 511]|uniref:protoporphyrinogen/coproporphyrinogen oxidase n=1 Tax=Dysgonomonas sp. 511 TaxID=2302930 RepID=UPI0013D7D073|nr:FAD-dependent oxidoreductase [Dysgonomonas sp. 511]NDV79566.1 FAD-dependent oxidoreductase [Dysgonomonas sp. 511]
MNKTIYDCIIIGGGVSGISFAHYLHTSGKKVLVLEQESKAGGQIKTLPSATKEGYWRELGAHTCYNSYTHLLSVVKDIDGKDLIQPLGKGSYVTFADRQIKKMFAKMSVLPMMINGWKVFFAKKENKTVKEYFSKIVGRTNYDKLFRYLFRAVISQNADNYPAQMFLKRRNGRFKEFPRKYTFTKGISSFIDAIIEKDGLQVVASSTVESIEKLADGYKLTMAQGEEYQATNIALATDPQTSAKLLADIEPALSGLLATIPLYHTESLNVVVPKDRLDMDAIAGIISLSDDFHSAVSRDLVEDDKVRSFTFHFRKGEKADDEKYRIILNVLNILPADIQEANEVKHILPSLEIQHIGMAGKVVQARRHDDIFILGNYFYGLSIEDCINRSHDEWLRYKEPLRSS